MQIRSIQRKRLPAPTPLVDIGVEDDHTFYVSDKPNGLYVLTHNSYPDIDSDFADRDKATKLLSEFFGEENVVPVSLFSQLQLKSLIKDVAKLHNLPFDEINSSTGKIEGEVLVVKKQEDGFDRATWDLTFEEAMLYSPTFQELMEKHPEFETTIKVLFKQMRNVGRHAGGVIITDNSREAMPMIKSGGELQTPWPEGVNYRHLEEFGLLKFDILGLGTLRMFENCTRRILRKQGVKNPTFKEVKQWFWDNLHPDNNPMDDMNVYKHVFWDGNYHSVFQFINDQTQGFMKQMKPKSILDIAAATSIFRPGPLSAGVDKLFLKNRSNPDRVVYKHPMLKEVFQETAGCLSGDSLVSTAVGDVRIDKLVETVDLSEHRVLCLNETTNELEYDDIVAVAFTGVKETYIVSTENGDIELTEDHVVYTTNGTKQVKDLTEEDVLLSLVQPPAQPSEPT